MNTEIMIINEYKLDLGVPRNQELLNQEMARFLSLPSGGGEAPQGAPPQATPTAAPAPDHGHGEGSHEGHAHGKDGHSHGKGGGSCC